MKNLFLNIFHLFKFEKKSKLYLMYFYIMILTLLEALSIALILPAIIIITQANQESNFFKFFETLSIYLDFDNIFVLFLIIFLFFYVLKFLISLFFIFIN